MAILFSPPDAECFAQAGSPSTSEGWTVVIAQCYNVLIGCDICWHGQSLLCFSVELMVYHQLLEV